MKTSLVVIVIVATLALCWLGIGQSSTTTSSVAPSPTPPSSAPAPSAVVVQPAPSAPAPDPAPALLPAPSISQVQPRLVAEIPKPTILATPPPVPMSPAEVLQANNQFHDALLGVSATIPQGWTMRSAVRWGANNEQNTIVLAPETPSTARPSMYYQMYPEAGPDLSASEAYLRQIAQSKENSRSGNGTSDYKNVPSSFEFKQIDGRPALSYFAVFSRQDQVMTEYFVRILGEKGYVMFFTTGRLEDVQAIKPQIDQMASTVKVP